MKPTATPKQTKELRHLVASAISDAKAYDVPGICSRLGMENGTSDEAMSSKYKYVSKRLADVGAPRVLEIARTYLTEEDHFELSEAVAKIDEGSEAAVTDLTRKRIIDVFEGIALTTEQEVLEFLRALWPIAAMRDANVVPGMTPQTLENAVVQNMAWNDNWTNKELLRAVGLSSLSRGQLFRFLAAVTHPLAQRPGRQAELVRMINAHLAHDGYALVETNRISGSPLYEVRTLARGAPSDAGISAALADFNSDHIHARWTAALERRATDPSGAITLARTLLEDVCKWILDQAGDPTDTDADDLPVLYRKLAKVLNLAPDGHTEQVFKQILGGCQSIVESLGSLRNKLSDAHSPGPKRAKPLPRHAELAVNLSGTMAMFLVATWEARRQMLETTTAA